MTQLRFWVQTDMFPGPLQAAGAGGEVARVEACIPSAARRSSIDEPARPEPRQLRLFSTGPGVAKCVDWTVTNGVENGR